MAKTHLSLGPSKNFARGPSSDSLKFDFRLWLLIHTVIDSLRLDKFAVQACCQKAHKSKILMQMEQRGSFTKSDSHP